MVALAAVMLMAIQTNMNWKTIITITIPAFSIPLPDVDIAVAMIPITEEARGEITDAADSVPVAGGDMIMRAEEEAEDAGNIKTDLKNKSRGNYPRLFYWNLFQLIFMNQIFHLFEY